MSNAACQSTRRDGTPCKATATASGHCFAHDASLQERTAEGRKLGGKNKSNAARAKKMAGASNAQIVRLVESAMGGVYKGSITPGQGQALASLAGAWVRLHEHGELETRLAELEAAADVRKGWGS